jgi:hypothetical protein
MNRAHLIYTPTILPNQGMHNQTSGDFWLPGTSDLTILKYWKIIFVVLKIWKEIPDVDNDLSRKCAKYQFKYYTQKLQVCGYEYVHFQIYKSYRFLCIPKYKFQIKNLHACRFTLLTMFGNFAIFVELVKMILIFLNNKITGAKEPKALSTIKHYIKLT